MNAALINDLNIAHHEINKVIGKHELEHYLDIVFALPIGETAVSTVLEIIDAEVIGHGALFDGFLRPDGITARIRVAELRLRKNAN